MKRRNRLRCCDQSKWPFAPPVLGLESQEKDYAEFRATLKWLTFSYDSARETYLLNMLKIQISQNIVISDMIQANMKSREK